MKHLLIGVLFSILTLTTVRADQIDSLINAINTTADPQIKFETTLEAARLMQNANDEQALSYFESAVELGKSISPSDELLAKAKLANYYHFIEDINQSIPIAKEIFQTEINPEATAIAHTVMSKYYQNKGIGDSIEYHDAMVLEIGTKHNLPKYRLVGLEGVAINNAIGGNFPAADSLWNEALVVAKQLDYKYNIANLYYNLGLLAYQSGDFEKANQYNLGGYQQVKDTEFHNLHIGFLNQLARFSFSNTDTTQAISYWEEGIRVADQTQNRSGQYAELLNNYIIRLSLIKDRDKSIEVSQKLYQLGKDNRRLDDELTGLSQLALMHALDGNKEKSAEFIDLAMPNLGVIKNSYVAGKVYFPIMTAMNEIGRHRDADKLLPAIKNLVERSPSPYNKLEYHKLNFTINKQLENYATALNALEKYKFIDDSIRAASNKQQLVDAKVRFEADEKEQQNVALAERNELIAKSNNRLLLALGALALLLAGLSYFFLKNKAAQKKIEAQNNELASVNATKDRLFAIISHDLRSEVSAFQNLNSIFNFHLERKNTDRLKEISEQVDKSAVTVNTLMDNLLQWSSSQLDGIRLHPEALNLKEQADSVLGLFEQYAETKGVNISTVLPEDLHIVADGNSLQFIIRNLMSNALKFTDSGDQIKITASESSDGVALRIEDSGTGIPREKLKRIWELDKKSSSQGTHGERGTGIGLSLVNDFVKRNNGRIHIESKENEGTSVTVLLPKAS